MGAGVAVRVLAFDSGNTTRFVERRGTPISEFSSNIVSAQQLARLSKTNSGSLGAFGLYASEGAVSVSSGMVLNVAAISDSNYCINGTDVATAYSASTVTITTAHATLNRIDLVKINTSGAVAVTAGTPASDPVPPTLAETELELAQVYVGAGVTSIVAGNITDRRQLIQRSTAVTYKSNTTQRDFSNTTFTTVQASSGNVQFAVAASRDYIIDIDFYVTALGTSGSGGLKAQLTFPTTPTLVQFIGSIPYQDADGTAPGWDNGQLIVAGSATSGTTLQLFSQTAVSAGSSDGLTTGWAKIRILVRNGTTAGDVVLQMAQNTAGGTSSISHVIATIQPVTAA